MEGSPNLTILSANSFPGLSFDYVMLYPSNLEIIESGFLQGGSTKELWLMGLSNLRFDNVFILIEIFFKKLWPAERESLFLLFFREFPFHDMKTFTNLEFFKTSYIGLEVIPGNIEWPSTLHTIEMRYSTKLQLIEPFAFSSAVNLQQIWVGEVAGNCVVQSNGFHTTSTIAGKTLILYPSSNANGEFITLEDNAFGNVDGGQLWDQLNLGKSDFNEKALRLLFKAHFDKQHSCKYTPLYFYFLQEHFFLCRTLFF